MITGISEYIDEVRCYEILNYATYNQAEVLFDIMGFAKPMDEVPFLLQPGQYADWLGDAWLQVLANPDKAPLEKIQKQPELF